MNHELKQTLERQPFRCKIETAPSAEQCKYFEDNLNYCIFAVGKSYTTSSC